MIVTTGTLLGRYEILSPLGSGGMGEVYLALDKQLNRRVAIKFPRIGPDEQHAHGRFIREARAVSMLNHPNIGAVYDYGEDSAGRPYLVMEYVKGKPLSDLLHESELTIPRAVEIVSQIADALTEAHANGVIHRDIKPSNVMIDERGAVKVLDFGLAKQLFELHGHTTDRDAVTEIGTRTQSGVVVGTPLYLSPEQATGREVDARSDVFALGAVLYECIAGRPAFSGKTAVEIIAEVIHVNPAPPSSVHSNVPKELDRITLKALSKNPDQRYVTAAQLRSELLDVVGQISNAEDMKTQRLVPQANPLSSAFTTISEALRTPRLSWGTVLAGVLIIFVSAFVVVRLLRSTPHQPLAAAQKWYEEGTKAIRDGTFYKASNNFKNALAIDPQFALAHARMAESLIELDQSQDAKDELLQAKNLIGDTSRLPTKDMLTMQALTAIGLRDFKGAIENYKNLVATSPDQEKPFALVDLGRAYEKNDQPDPAIESYQQSANLNPQYATAYLRLGVLYGRRQKAAEARAAFDKAEPLYRDYGNYEGVAETIYQRAVFLVRMANLDEALAEIQRALAVAQTVSNPSQRIRSLLQLGIIWRTKGDYDKARDYINQAIQLARSNQMDDLTAQSLITLGSISQSAGDLPQAEDLYTQALDSAHRFKGRLNEARAQLSLGSLYIEEEDAEKGLVYVQQALPFYEQNGYRRETSQARLLFAQGLRLKGDYEQAVKLLEPELQAAEQSGDKAQATSLNTALANTFLAMERYPEALEKFEAAVKKAEAAGDPLKRAYGVKGRGQMLMMLGRLAEAQAQLDEALAVAEKKEGGNKRLAAEASLCLAQLNRISRKFSDAQVNARRAIEFDPSSKKSVAIEANSQLGMALVQSGQSEAGMRLCQQALQSAIQTGNPLLISRTMLLLAEAQQATGDTSGALANARAVVERFHSAGQQLSEWEASVTAALAAKRSGDSTSAKESADRANSVFANFQQGWDENTRSAFLARPDVQALRQESDKALRFD